MDKLVPVPEHNQIAKGSHDVWFTELWRVHGRLVRLRIRSNFYREQCFAIAEVWSGKRWHEAWSLHSETMKTPKGLASSREDLSAAFDDDRGTLLAAVEEVSRG